MLARNPEPSAFSAAEKRQCLRMYNRLVSTDIPVSVVVLVPRRMEFSPTLEPPSFDVEEWIKYLPEKRLPRYDAIFVGGGPIALLTAIFAKVKNDVLNILIFEKRSVYLRTHSLRIDTDAFPGYPQGLNVGIDAEVTDLRGRVVPIQEVEERLKRIALSLNIQIEYVHVKNPRKLPSIFPETRMFIGADGAKSVVRKDIFGDAFRVKRIIERLMLIQYRVREKAKAYKLIKDIPRSESTVYSMPLTLIEDRVGRDGVSKTLTFSISDEFYPFIKDARMTNPFTLKSPTLPEKIRTSFFLWCGMKEETEGEVRIEGSEKITAIDGEARVSKHVIKQIGERRAWWALAGDAAISLPLQRGFNTSGRAAVYLADAIADCTINNRLDKGKGVEGLASEQAALYAAFCARVKDLELCTFGCPLTSKQRDIRNWEGWMSINGFIWRLSQETKERYINAGKEHAVVEIDL